MASSEFGWEHLPLLQILREKLEDNKDSNVSLESYAQEECIQIFNEALSTNTANYICVDGDGTVPIESTKADGLNTEARVGVPGEHRGILCERHVFRILKHWLKAGEPDPYYDPINDFVILPTAFEGESHKEKRFNIEFVKEEWEFVSADPDGEQCNMLVTNKAADQPSQHDVFTAVVNDLNQANHCLESRNSSVTVGAL